MSISANQEKDPMWQAAVLAISEARDQIGKNFGWPSECGSAGGGTAPQPSQGQLGGTHQKVEQPNENAPALAGTASEQSPITPVPHRWVLKTIIGLTTLLAVCTATFDWQFSRDHAAPDPLSTSSVLETSHSNPVSNNLTRADVEPRQSPSPAPDSGQRTALTSASTGATPSATDASIEMLSRQIARLEEALDRLSNHQSGVDRDSTDLAGQLKVMREQMARGNAAMDDRLTALEAQVRDNASMAEQLKALRSQVERDNAAISEQLRGKDQVERVVAKTTEQRQKPKPLRQTTTRPVSSSPQAVARPPAPRVRQQAN